MGEQCHMSQLKGGWNAVSDHGSPADAPGSVMTHLTEEQHLTEEKKYPIFDLHYTRPERNIIAPK